MKKITSNKYYNTYKYNNSGMFVCMDQYCVGEDSWKDECDLGTHKNIAISVANRLNKQKQKKMEKIELEKYKCPNCEKWEIDKEYMDTNEFDICKNCDVFIEKSELDASTMIA